LLKRKVKRKVKSKMELINELDLMEEHWNLHKQDYTTETILLAKHLGVSVDDAESYIDDDDYLVLTDEEADDRVYDEIADSVWAFKPSFLAAHTGVTEEAIEKLQEMCEGANEALTAMIKNFDAFVEDAVRSDGRGHFLSDYDSNEYEVCYTSAERNGNAYKVKDTYYYIYRRN